MHGAFAIENDGGAKLKEQVQLNFTLAVQIVEYVI